MKKEYIDPKAEVIMMESYITTGLTPSDGNQNGETVDINDLLDD